MSEQEWVKTIFEDIEKDLRQQDGNHTILVTNHYNLPYSSENLSYNTNDEPAFQNHFDYQTDLLIYEQIEDNYWKPRIVIETKLESITTHDAITYSQKAQTHKNVHPYLRYGILIGNCKQDSLPGRIFRHGQHFDFMLAWQKLTDNKDEWNRLIGILDSELKASRALENIIFNSRSHDREKYTSFHRQLIFEG